MSSSKLDRVSFGFFLFQELVSLVTSLACLINPREFQNLVVVQEFCVSSVLGWTVLYAGMIIISIVLLAMCIRARVWKLDVLLIGSLSCFIMICGSWIYLETGIPLMLAPSFEELWRLLSFFTFHLMLVPFLLFARRCFTKGKDLFLALAWVIMAMFVFNYIWLVASGMEYPPTLLALHIMLVVSIAAVIWASMWEMRKGKATLGRPIVIGSFVVALAGLADLCTYYLSEPLFHSSTFFIGIALSAFLIVIAYVNFRSFSRSISMALGCQSLASELPSGIFRSRLDDSLSVELANKAFYETYGFQDREQALSEGFVQGMRMSPDKLSGFVEDLRRSIALGQKGIVVEAQQNDRSGKPLWLQTHLHYAPEQDSVLGFVVDLTSRKLAEDSLKESEEQLRLTEQQYMVTLAQTGLNVYRYDIDKDTAYLDGNLVSAYGLPKVIADVQSFITEGSLIVKESQKTFLDFIGSLDNGQKSARCDVEVELASSQRLWIRQSASIVFDYGRPRHAIITLSDITMKRANELAFEDWKASIDALGTKSIAKLRWNLASNRLEQCSGDLIRLSCPVDGFDRHLAHIIDTHVALEDRGLVAGNLSVDKLIRSYESKNYERKVGFRLQKGTQMSLLIRLMESGTGPDVTAYIVLKKIEESIDSDLGCCDSLTGLLARQAFEAKASQDYVSSSRPFCIAIMDLDGFGAVNSLYGHDVGDQSLVNAAQAIESVIDSEGIVGRYGNDEFIAAFACSSMEQASLMARRLCLRIKTIFSERLKLTMTVGLSLSAGFRSLDEMLKKASKALEKAKTVGTDGFAYSDEA